jgi:hypothetical protein
LARLHSIPAEQIGAGPHDGIAIFASQDFLRVVDLQKRVEPLCVVAESFHIKPLIRTAQNGDRFEILCFSPNRVRLLEGNADGVSELPLRGVPSSLHDARVVPVVGPNQANAHEAAAVQIEHFIRLVDQAVWETHSRTSHLPLIVAADVKHLADFLAVTKNPCVMESGIPHSPDQLGDDRLRDEAWKILAPQRDREMQQLIDRYRAAKAHAKGTDELFQVAEAAAMGRVGTLMVDADRRVPGVLHSFSGLIEQARALDPRAEDLLDDLAELVLKKDGQVYVLPHEQMPTDAGVAAVFRY